MSFSVLITQEGLNRTATANGTKIEITHIGIGDAHGDSGYTPTRDMTALVSERLRRPIGGAINRGDGRWQVSADLTEQEIYAVREVGYYMDDGTLFALWSHPVNVMFHQTLINNALQAFDLILQDVPPDSVEIIQTGTLNMFYDEEFYAMTIAQTQMAAASVQSNVLTLSLSDRILKLEQPEEQP